MFSRVQNRNAGYSDNLFSQNPRVENNTLSSIDGATALKLDESYQLDEEQESESLASIENNTEKENFIGATEETEEFSTSIPKGVSIESASYIENSNLDEKDEEQTVSENYDKDYTPRLFSEEESYQSDEQEDPEELFDQDLNEEDDFEIPAFLRKQKF